ncbi:hypothetical protein [Roseitalea sp. MMSF_3546]|nr:hypothetical protein [Roseitalea sp. MMSF_3546]
MPEPEDMVMPMLREMRAEMRESFASAQRRFDGVDERLDRIEEAQKNFRHALTADTMMSRLVTGDFEERIKALEAKVDDLMKAR